MNKVFMVGRLAADPQQFITQNGITQSRVTIASSDNWNKNETYFFPCVAWQSQANFINTYLKKGDLVAIDGKLIRRSYLTKEGKTNYVMEVVIEVVKPLSNNKNNNNIHNEYPSSIDENFKSAGNNFNNTTKNNSLNDDTKLNELKDMIENEKDLTSGDENDPFEINNDDSSDDVVNLDWLKDFSN